MYRIVLTTYLTDNVLIPDLQSAYRAYHSTDHWDRRAEGRWWHSSGTRLLQSGSAVTARPVGSVRHRRPRHAASTAADVLRPRRRRHQMVRVIPERPDEVRANTDHHVAAITCRVCSPSMIRPRTDPFSAVRRQPVAADQMSPAVPSRLCRRLKSMASVSQVTSTPSLTGCPPASMNCRLGCGPTSCNWTYQRLKCFGVLLVDDSIRPRLRQYVSAVAYIVLPVSSVCDLRVSTPTSVCKHMSPPPSDRALQQVKSSQWCSTDVDCSQPLCPYHNNQIIYTVT